jgi:hypothetical protein
VIVVPEWGLGVALIILAVSMRRALPRLVHAVADRMAGRVGATSLPAPTAESLDDLQRRLADVEERLDFAERLLAQQREAERLGSSRS